MYIQTMQEENALPIRLNQAHRESLERLLHRPFSAEGIPLQDIKDLLATNPESINVYNHLLQEVSNLAVHAVPTLSETIDTCLQLIETYTDDPDTLAEIHACREQIESGMEKVQSLVPRFLVLHAFFQENILSLPVGDMTIKIDTEDEKRRVERMSKQFKKSADAIQTQWDAFGISQKHEKLVTILEEKVKLLSQFHINDRM